ncbi:MAG: ATP-dependent DNA helicase [Lachnospiraceae bacterium]
MDPVMGQGETEVLEVHTIQKPMIRISVRKLVEFILRSGNIDNRRSQSPEKAMMEGNRIHRMIQRRMGSNYQPEVPLSLTISYDAYDISVEGRADGILTEQTQIESGDRITIDEIKGTYRKLSKITHPIPVHVAQAKVYAYIYALQHRLSYIRVRMTYCNIETEEVRYFHEEYSFVELRDWFEGLIGQYRKWADYEIHWKKLRQESISQLAFPFPYRKGQRELVAHVYRTMQRGKKLFTVAPTGVGKTISTIFPAIQSMGQGMGDKIFYLTAKTITRTVADDTFAILRETGLRCKSVMLTAKEKICPLEVVECNPLACPYARGHYDRINDAIYELVINQERYTREDITACAKQYQVCPYEMELDLCFFSDAVICDYNYVFDPCVYLKRFFADSVEGDYLFLIDEAHNLLDRGREMYSATLCKEDFLSLRRIVKPYDMTMEKQLETCNKEMLLLKRVCDTEEANGFCVVEQIAPFTMSAERLYTTMNKFLEEHDDSEVKNEILDLFFKIAHFLEIYELIDDNYVMYTEIESQGTFILKLFCVNPAVNLRERMKKARSTILFSATLLPIQYYKTVLGGEADDYEVYAQSVFDSRKRAILIGRDVTSKYTRRGELEYQNIAAYIHEAVKNRHGNYLLFFPSHGFLQAVYQVYMESYYDAEHEDCIFQEEYMNEASRETFLNRFRGNEMCDLTNRIQITIEIEEEKSLLGFCVMGGIFSEGIDLTEDKLIGAIIVGTGLPQVCHERDLIQNYFAQKGEDGFAYAYCYPGMNKVLQAAGRVIRTDKDVGIIVLLDERFLEHSYQQLFPPDWTEQEIVTKKSIARRIERFWDEWL